MPIGFARAAVALAAAAAMHHMVQAAFQCSIALVSIADGKKATRRVWSKAQPKDCGC